MPIGCKVSVARAGRRDRPSPPRCPWRRLACDL